MRAVSKHHTFYVMSKKVYSDPNIMILITEIKRFMDDGAGFFSGTVEQFNKA